MLVCSFFLESWFWFQWYFSWTAIPLPLILESLSQVPWQLPSVCLCVAPWQPSSEPERHPLLRQMVSYKRRKRHFQIGAVEMTCFGQHDSHFSAEKKKNNNNKINLGMVISRINISSGFHFIIIFWPFSLGAFQRKQTRKHLEIAKSCFNLPSWFVRCFFTQPVHFVQQRHNVLFFVQHINFFLQGNQLHSQHKICAVKTSFSILRKSQKDCWKSTKSHRVYVKRVLLKKKKKKKNLGCPCFLEVRRGAN